MTTTLELPAPPASRSFSSPEVCRAVGISYRQLDYWDRTGLLTPSVAPARGSGYSRRYDLGDVFTLRVINELRRVGVAVQSPLMRRAVALVARPFADLRHMALVIFGGDVELIDNTLRLRRDATLTVVPLDPLLDLAGVP